MRKFIKFFALFFAVFLTPVAARAVDIQEVVAPKTGVKAWLVEDHRLPILALRLAFQGGGEQDRADKQGLAFLTMEAITQGAGALDAAAFQQRLADRSISMSFSAGRDRVDGGFKCLKEDQGEAFKLMNLALAKPRFDAPDIERLRGQQLSAIRNQFSDPGWQARYALVQKVFADHPYNQRILGTEQTLQSISRKDIRDFAAHHFALDSVTVAVAGDITPEELSVALDNLFKGLPKRAKLRSIPDIAEFPDASTILVRREGTQTNILFGMPGPKRSDPDFYAAEILNYILGGGGFSSRLMQELRDKQGLTYGVSTGLAPSQHAGMIAGTVAVDNPKASVAAGLVRRAIRRLRSDGPTLREIEAAKDYLTGSMPLALTSTNNIAALLIEMQREDLGRDYLDRYGDLVRSVSGDDIERVLEKYFNLDKMTMVFVGKPEGIVPDQTKDTVKQ